MQQRAKAYLIDMIPLVILMGLDQTVGVADHKIDMRVSIPLWMCYLVGMNYLYGGTLGKRMVGLRVVVPSSPDVLLRLGLRAFIKVVCLFPPMLWAYGLIAIWRQDGRSLADFLSGSTVVEVSTLAPPKPSTDGPRILASFEILFSPLFFVFMLR